jgi:superfamily II DNA or RNA helicase
VSKHFLALNPGRRPTILFAPGVRESHWLAEQFYAIGISAAHMAAGELWINGKWLEDTSENRERVLAASKSGEVVVLCNRFILREGIDCPWLSHGILATIFGSVQSYLQSCGRLLRACPGKDRCTIQDHGGNWWRHGSPNEDREWKLGYGAGAVYGLRADAIREKLKQEPWCCPKCLWIMTDKRCTACGWELGHRRSRPVVTVDGTMTELTGEIFRPHRIHQAPNGRKLWERMYWRSRTEKGSRSFRPAFALYARENGAYPDLTWPLMPIDEMDRYRLITDVPMDRLRRPIDP